MELTPTEVTETFKYCLWDDDFTETPTIYEGVSMRASFDPKKLKEKESHIMQLLKQLPNDFKQSGGGGMSFLNMCMKGNGENQELWTGMHSVVDQLFLLGNAIGKAKFLAPREEWDTMFIAGMPYILILDK